MVICRAVESKKVGRFGASDTVELPGVWCYSSRINDIEDIEQWRITTAAIPSNRDRNQSPFDTPHSSGISDWNQCEPNGIDSPFGEFDGTIQTN
jgi:hypothetical protein